MDIVQLRDALKAKKMSPEEKREAAKKLIEHYRKGRKDLSAFQIGSVVRDAIYNESPAGKAAEASMYEKPEYEYWYVDDVYPLENYAVICVGKNLHYKVPFTIGEGDVIMLSPKEDWKKVVYKWVEAE